MAAEAEATREAKAKVRRPHLTRKPS